MSSVPRGWWTSRACRCGAYPGIVAAIQEVHSGRRTANTWGFVDEQRLARVRQEETDATV